MKAKLLYLIASILAFVAAALRYFLADPGEDVTLSVAVPLIIGIVMLVLGMRNTGVPGRT